METINISSKMENIVYNQGIVTTNTFIKSPMINTMMVPSILTTTLILKSKVSDE